jgi:hypothetical protein
MPQLPRRHRGHEGVVDSQPVDLVPPAVDADDPTVARTSVAWSDLGARPRTARVRSNPRIRLVEAPQALSGRVDSSMVRHISGKAGMVLAVVPTWMTRVPGTLSPMIAPKVAIRWS